MGNEIEQRKYTRLRWMSRVLWWLGLILLSPGYLFWLNDDFVLQVLSGAPDRDALHLVENGIAAYTRLGLIRSFYLIGGGHVCWALSVFISLTATMSAPEKAARQPASLSQGVRMILTWTTMFAALALSFIPYLAGVWYYVDSLLQ